MASILILILSTLISNWVHNKVNFVLFAQPMQNIIENQMNHSILSPALFMSDVKPLQQCPQLSLQRDSSSEIEEPIIQNNSKPLNEIGGGSDKDEKKKLAGIKSRQKKKKYIQTLQETVKSLTAELDLIETEILTSKDKLVEAIKISSKKTNQHQFTYKELERTAKQEYPDFDRINLLLDLIQNRIGANAKERQAKLDYNFKQIINSLFPAMHRYFMHSSIRSLDLFQRPDLQQIGCQWTSEIFALMKLASHQIQKIYLKKDQFKQKRRQTITLIQRLKKIKKQLKEQQQIFEQTMSDIRKEMNPVQSALMIVFGQNNKLRRQFSVLVDQFEAEDTTSKKIKLESSS